jgi:hypothetical protein
MKYPSIYEGIYQNSTQTLDIADGAFYEFYKQIIGKDVEKCFNYCMIVAWNIVDLIKYSYVDPFLATVTAGLIIHKSPVVYRTCNYTIVDISQFDNVTAALYGDQLSFETVWHLIENSAFNSGDMMYLLI